MKILALSARPPVTVHIVVRKMGLGPRALSLEDSSVAGGPGADGMADSTAADSQ